MKTFFIFSALAIVVLLFAIKPAISDAQRQTNLDHQRWVDWEAETQARQGVMRHIQRCPPGYRAGVGWSTRSAEDAVRNCCYWNRSSRARWFAVRKGRRGWYAAALYR
jgi:hypothetical protein